MKGPKSPSSLRGPRRAECKRLDIYYLEQTEELLDRARFRLTAAAATGLPPPPGHPTGVVTAAAAGTAVAGMWIMRRKRCCVCRATRLAAAAVAMPKVGRREGGQWRPRRRISEAD